MTFRGSNDLSVQAESNDSHFDHDIKKIWPLPREHIPYIRDIGKKNSKIPYYRQRRNPRSFRVGLRQVFFFMSVHVMEIVTIISSIITFLTPFELILIVDTKKGNTMWNMCEFVAIWVSFHSENIYLCNYCS